MIQFLCDFVQPCKANAEYLDTNLMAFILLWYDQMALNFIYYRET